MKLKSQNNVILGEQVSQVKDLSKPKTQFSKVFKAIPGVPRGKPKTTNFNLTVPTQDKNEEFPFNLTNRIEIYKSEEDFKKGRLISGYISLIGSKEVEVISYQTEPDDTKITVKGKKLAIPFSDLRFMVKKVLPGQGKSVYQFVFRNPEKFIPHYKQLKSFL